MLDIKIGDTVQVYRRVSFREPYSGNPTGTIQELKVFKSDIVTFPYAVVDFGGGVSQVAFHNMKKV